MEYGIFFREGVKGCDPEASGRVRGCAADILNVFIHGGRQTVQAGLLYPAPTETEYASPGCAMRSQLEDISKYEIRDGRIRVQYLLANQSDVDRRMVLRRAGYAGAVYREQYDGKVRDLFPVVSLVLYWGKERWRSARSMRELMGEGELSPRLWELADECRLHVFEMRRLSPEVRELFTSDMRHVVDYLAEGDSFWSERLVVHKEALVRMLRALGGDTDVEDTPQILKEMDVKEEDEIKVCELFEQYERRGRKKGRQEGMEAGRKEGMKTGISEGIKKGLQALISTCRELGISFDVTAAKVKEKYFLEDDEVQEEMRLYW